MKLYFIRILILVFVLFVSKISYAQNGTSRQNVTIIEDPRIVSLVEKHIYLNEKQKNHRMACTDILRIG